MREDIDDQIQAFCASRTRLETGQVIRDIARIVCIVNMVRNGTLDGENMVLCGGMAMRCLDSPRMSIYDGDTASRNPPDTDALPSRISHDEDDMEIAAGPWTPSRELITFAPVTYDARFSQLAGAQDQFSLSVAYRGIERPAIWRSLNHRYPFPLLAEDVLVPIMDPDEILAEKTVAWWLFGHAKHYNDIAFLAGRLLAEGRHTDEGVRANIRRLVEVKLAVNAQVSQSHGDRIQSMNEQTRMKLLEAPDEHVDPKRSFNNLSYLQDAVPSREQIAKLVKRVLMPVLFG